MGGRLLEGLTMVGGTSDWNEELGCFLKPFLDRLGHKARRRMCPLYVSGLIGPGDRKSIAPMAKRLALGECDQLHHFIAAGVWDATPVETELLVQADRLVGGSDAVLVIDDTAIPKKGTYSVGVAAQYASALGSWNPASPQGLACRCADDLAGCQARSSPSAARPRHSIDTGRGHAGQCQMADHQLAHRHERKAQGSVCCCPRAGRRRTTAAD